MRKRADDDIFDERQLQNIRRNREIPDVSSNAGIIRLLPLAANNS